MSQTFNLSEFLAANVRPALGCTEVVVIGLASSAAFLASQGKLPCFLQKKPEETQALATASASEAELLSQLEAVRIEVDRNVFKNALSVNLPMPDELIDQMEKGIEFAAALGIFSPLGQKSAGEMLNLFSAINPELIAKAKSLRRNVRFNVEVVDSWTGQADLNVRVQLSFKTEDKTKCSEARISHSHTHFSYIANSMEVLYKDEANDIATENQDNQLLKLSKMSLRDMIDTAQNLDSQAWILLEKNIQINTDLSLKGLEGRHGLKLGKSLQKLVDDGILADDMTNYAKIKVAAAADARMGGAMRAAMSTAGSGNQGIAATLPIMAVADRIGAEQLNISATEQKKRLMSALALSHLLTSYIAYYAGHLSALCGCAVKAGIGAAAGISFYLGGDEKKITGAINNVAANIIGIICDGAKEGCALKLATSSEAAVESALLAMQEVTVPLDNGILAETVEQTLQNIGKISNAMVKTDQVIVQETMLR
ncbi:MAG: serine dehydratase subunit alpha family protein [Candidatus Aenigmarchaeota archaeon]|nr:serine dehydratase subunit alpha family protein [Candidatus Aenigmarchaeota archaeon]